MIVEEFAKPLLHKRVLVVEDAPENRFLFAYLLEEAGADVEVAEHGGQAVDLIHSHAFDLVLMDINMPVMNGFEVMKKLGSQQSYPPIVALTAHESTAEETKIYGSGFQAWLPKPIEPHLLIEKLQHILQL